MDETEPPATWRRHLMLEMDTNDDPGPVVQYAPDEASFDVEFDDDYGRVEGPHVLAWTAAYVYFPVTYDGRESIGSAPRNPRSSGQEHVGG